MAACRRDEWTMRIERVINNNVVSALDEKGKEIVAMGKGIGFQKKPGNELSEQNIEKIFRLESPDVLEGFKELLVNIPLVCIQISDEIISHAKQVLPQQLSQSVYLTLTDHINFALTRFRQGLLFENALYSEIKRFYPQEFTIGKFSVELIEEKTGVRLPGDEAASIAFHLVNAEFGQKLHDTQVMTEMLRHLLGMVDAIQPLSDDSIYTDRLITNLKFILNRLLLQKPAAANRDEVFNEFIRCHCTKEYELAQKMRDYIQSVSSCLMTDEEVIYLTVQLKYTVTIYAKNS